MFKLVKAATLEQLKIEIERLKYVLNETNILLEQEQERYSESLDEYNRSRNEYLSKIDEITKADITNSDENTVRLVVSKDLQKITPYVKYRADCFENLFQEGMLTDAQADSPHSIQLALMMIASDGLTQLLDSFSEQIDDV